MLKNFVEVDVTLLLQTLQLGFFRNTSAPFLQTTKKKSSDENNNSSGVCFAPARGCRGQEDELSYLPCCFSVFVRQRQQADGSTVCDSAF